MVSRGSNSGEKKVTTPQNNDSRVDANLTPASPLSTLLPTPQDSEEENDSWTDNMLSSADDLDKDNLFDLFEIPKRDNAEDLIDDDESLVQDYEQDNRKKRRR